MGGSVFQRLKQATINTAFILALLAALIPGAGYLQVAEGRLYPVVVDVELVYAGPYGDGDETEIILTFDKVRECHPFLGMDWYIDTARGYEKVLHRYVRSYTNDQDSSRPTGVNVSEPWIISVPYEDFGRTFAEVQHRCHPYWITVTQFWP
jgi:hypothetical protein